jgi:hypothetical protein
MSVHSTIAQTTRPRILVKAAKISAQHYERTMMLGKILRTTKLPSHASAITLLTEREEALNEARLIHDASYRIQHHITVLSALMGEMHLQGH